MIAWSQNTPWQRQSKGGAEWMMMIENEQQMAWNYLDLQLYIFGHDVII